MTVANIPALHCCQYNLTVNAIIYCNRICIVKYVYASVFAILNDKLLTIYWTWQFPNFPIFSVFYSVVFQIYCIPFVPRTNQKQFIITVIHILLMTASECIHKCFPHCFPKHGSFTAQKAFIHWHIWVTAAMLQEMTETICTSVLTVCPHQTAFWYLLTYLLHGAQSFLRS